MGARDAGTENHPLIDLSSCSSATKSRMCNDGRDNRDRGRDVKGLTHVGDVFMDLTSVI